MNNHIDNKTENTTKKYDRTPRNTFKKWKHLKKT